MATYNVSYTKGPFRSIGLPGNLPVLYRGGPAVEMNEKEREAFVEHVLALGAFGDGQRKPDYGDLDLQDCFTVEKMDDDDFVEDDLDDLDDLDEEDEVDEVLPEPTTIPQLRTWLLQHGVAHGKLMRKPALVALYEANK